MKDYIVNLGLNEQATITPSKSVLSGKLYTDYQSQLNQYVTHDLLYEYTPNFNGGYVIFVDPGPWPELIKHDKRLQDKYGSSIVEYADVIKEFMMNSMKLAFQIDPGTVNASADNYNLRHLNQNVFSYDTKINNISITYLEERNLVEFTHMMWIDFMSDLKKGFVDLPDEYLAKDTDIFYPVPYYGQIWAYAYNPIDLRPREIVKYVGVFPSNDTLSDSFGQRGQNNHYMKNIQYNIVDHDRSVYPTTKKMSSNDHFSKFYTDSVLFREFIDLCVEKGLLRPYKG